MSYLCLHQPFKLANTVFKENIKRWKFDWKLTASDYRSWATAICLNVNCYAGNQLLLFTGFPFSFSFFAHFISHFCLLFTARSQENESAKHIRNMWIIAGTGTAFIIAVICFPFINFRNEGKREEGTQPLQQQVTPARVWSLVSERTPSSRPFAQLFSKCSNLQH